MKNLLLTLSLLLSCVPVLAAGEKHSAAEVKADVERHRAMSAAHDAAAKCLESGKKPDVCHKELSASCKGIAIGKYCGMKHSH